MEQSRHAQNGSNGFKLFLKAANLGDGIKYQPSDRAPKSTRDCRYAIRSWRRAASTDLPELMGKRSVSCAILGMAGATLETVACLRDAFEEPSYAMPFIDPFYPYYDSIRDEPEFVELLAEFDGKQ